MMKLLFFVIIIISTPPLNAGSPGSRPAIQQPQKEIRGVVKDPQGAPLFGATVMIKGTTIGIITDASGSFVLQVPSNAQTLVVSFIGMTTQEIPIENRTVFEVSMKEESVGLGEVVVVGYGQQKRESIVGAITNTTNADLEKRGGVVNLASALSGQLPGVVVMERTGEPGKEDPLILIRGESTWNGASPLILVDGVERRMNDLNVNEVESVSVLKDASATAVFGVKGANGVILITTKRGQIGRAKLSLSANYGFKDVSKIFTLEEAYTAQMWKNAAIEHEVVANETYWQYYLPYEQVLRSKRPQARPDLYPNIDWTKEVLKPYANNSQVNLNVTGGTEFAKYFASIAYTNEGDILRSDVSSKGYDGGYAYNRLNFRGNLDFALTKTTNLSTNISGYAGMKKDNMAYSNNWIFSSLYELPPDAFPVKYPDGYYGKDPADLNTHNPMVILNETGVERQNRLFIGSDIKLEQRLDVITKGLSANINVSYDNYFGSSGPNITDIGNQGQTLYEFVYPSILDAKTHSDSLNAVVYFPSANATAVNEYDFVTRPWTIAAPTVSNGLLQRTLFYQASLNYARSFAKNDITGLVLFNRRKNATGPDFPNFREDWVGRVTYAYGNKYFGEVNGAYNGSEKFGPGYRFGFFPSLALGWMLSNESFLDYSWLYKFKIRGSIGKVGSDAGINRWGYIGSWTTGATNNYKTNSPAALFGNTNGVTTGTSMTSPYTYYWEGTIPNPDINWETAIKKNIGFELALFDNMISIEADFFKDNRDNIFLNASRRNIPVYFGAPAVSINYGQTETKGFELDMMFRKTLKNGFNYWFRESMTRAKDLVLRAEDPALQDDYQKVVGYQISQTKSSIRDGSISTNWDMAYGIPGGDSNVKRLPGEWGIIDFNGDGKINSYDNVPYAFPSDRPANTYSTFAGIGYKNFSFMIQFYGVTNITQSIYLTAPQAVRVSRLSSYLVDYWTKDNPDASFMAPRIQATMPGFGDFGKFDGSYLRLKTIEISYGLPVKFVNRIGLSSMRFYANGNNLFFWSDLPMDNESGSYDVSNAYPTYKVVNFGVDVVF